VKRVLALLLVGLALAAQGAQPAESAKRVGADVEAVVAPAPDRDATARHRCPGATGVVVGPASADHAALVCEGVARALHVLARAGLVAPSETRIEIVRQLPGALAGRAVGCYLRDTRNILLLDYEAFEAIGEWFRTPVDRELYRSAAAHEMAHAMVGCNTSSDRLPTAAHEYVAYVVLFATMDPELRERVLAKFPGRGFTSTLQISEVGHLADPNQFGVDAWRHYLGRRDREAWLRAMIAGGVVQELPDDAP
jgi:hypothetical protein